MATGDGLTGKLVWTTTGHYGPPVSAAPSDRSRWCVCAGGFVGLLGARTRWFQFAGGFAPPVLAGTHWCECAGGFVLLGGHFGSC
jgi:hypothetical protein